MRRVPWMTCCVVALLPLTACAPAATTGSATAPEPTAPAPTAPAPTATKTAKQRSGTDPECTKATKVKIVDDAFTPARLTIRRGGFLAVTNRSGQAYALVSQPDAGIVTSVVDSRERQVIQFPKAGEFEVADQKYRATLRVTVTGESGCGAPKARLTIGNGGTVTPATLTVVATENFAVVNKSGSARSVGCTPGSNQDNARLEKGETQLLAIDEPGRYTCAKATVTVRRR